MFTESGKIVLLSIAAAVVYGISQDQITARICVEYFTVGHERLIAFESPTVLGFFWGTVATWWVGLPLGVGLAVASRAGARPKLAWRDVVRPIGVLILVVAVAAAAAGVAGFLLAESGAIRLTPRFASRVPMERHSGFLADGAAHLMAYAMGICGGVVTCVVVWRRRRRGERVPLEEPDQRP